MGSVTVSTHAGIGKGNTITNLNDRRHLLQIDLVHDAVPSRYHIHITECRFAPLNKMEAICIAPRLNDLVVRHGIGVRAIMLHRQGVVDDQLGGHYRVDPGRISTLPGNGITQPRQVNQCRLAENIMTNDSGWIPGKILFTTAFNYLAQVVGQTCIIATTYQLLSQYPGAIWEPVIAASLDSFYRCARVEIVQRGAG